jgi:hypothetical protein
MNPHTPKGAPTLGVGVSMDSQIFIEQLQRSNSSNWEVFYIIGNLLKRSYDQKKGRESNWQFNSRPLKVKNLLDLFACRWHATYCWKALDKGYNFALDLISIRRLNTKLWAPKVTGVPVVGISTKCHLGAGPVARHNVYYKGEGGESRPWWVLWVWVCSWFILTPKMFKLCTNQLVVWFVQVHVSNWCLSLFLVPIPKLQHAPLPPKCCEPKSVPQLLTFLLFSP